MRRGQGKPQPGVNPNWTEPCDKGDEYAGFYHSHPGIHLLPEPNSILSQEDIKLAKTGFGAPETKEETEGKPVGATTRDKSGKLVTEIWPPIHP